MKPFFSLDCGWDVKLPNSSEPSSIMPLPFRSNASQASSVPEDVHEILSLTPSGLRSKFTPPTASVTLKPFPKTSINTGHPGPTSGSPQNPPLHTKPLQHSGSSLQVSPVPKHSPPPSPPPPEGQARSQ